MRIWRCGHKILLSLIYMRVTRRDVRCNYPPSSSLRSQAHLAERARGNHAPAAEPISARAGCCARCIRLERGESRAASVGAPKNWRCGDARGVWCVHAMLSPMWLQAAEPRSRVRRSDAHRGLLEGSQPGRRQRLLRQHLTLVAGAAPTSSPSLSPCTHRRSARLGGRQLGLGWAQLRASRVACR